jgi:hypothetical protein
LIVFKAVAVLQTPPANSLFLIGWFAVDSVSASQTAGNIEQDHWLIPIEDRRTHTNAPTTSDRDGLLPTFSLGSYLQLNGSAFPLLTVGTIRKSSFLILGQIHQGEM